MVMIDTYARVPEESWRDVNELVDRAKSRGLVPLEWRLGFFIARDLVFLHIQELRQVRKMKDAWTPLTHLCGLPAFVVELEDRIQLLVAPPDGRGHIRAAEKSLLTIDRRASGD
jgi:hypothetical protein